MRTGISMWGFVPAGLWKTGRKILLGLYHSDSVWFNATYHLSLKKAQEGCAVSLGLHE